MVIKLERRSDERGFFARVWCEGEFRKHGLDPRIAQINTGFSPRAGTLRGLHFQQVPCAEVKVVRCLRGAVFDVAVDLRKESPSYRQWFGMHLTASGGESLYVPEGCGHGYLTLEDNSEVMYLASRPFSAEHASGVRYNDPAFGIQWPMEAAVISDADQSWPDFTG